MAFFVKNDANLTYIMGFVVFISFSVENFRSFSDKQELSMVASASSRKRSNISFASSNSFAPHLLRSACVFGSNGAGKTSLLSALDFFGEYVVHSAQEMQEGDEIDVTPHLFSRKLASEPSEFEIIFIYKEVLYQYGFAANNERVISEWLFAKPNAEKSRMRSLFFRDYSQSENRYSWDINNTFVKGEKEVWKKSTRSNALFLSQAVQLNSEDLREPFEWIRNNLKVIDSPTRLSPGYTANKCLESSWKEKIVKLLRSVDVRITDLSVTVKDLDPSDIPDHIPNEVRNMMLERIRDKKQKAFKINSIHENAVGDKIELSLDSESDGTNVLFGLAGPWFDVLENGYTLVVDELNNSLHPHALKALVRLFNDPETNPSNAQLIFTSHDTAILAKGFMHQDQIWIAEKSEVENTILIPLSDFKVRDVRNFQKAYLDGRYGGIPKVMDHLHG